MNKFIGALALAGLIVISNSAAVWQSAEIVKADPTPGTDMELTVGSSPECPNYSNGTLRVESPAGGVASAENNCFITTIAGSGAADTVLSIETESSIFSNLPTSTNLGAGFINYPVSVEFDELSADSYSASITVTAVSTYNPIVDFAFNGASQSTGSYQIFIAPFSAIYQLEVWGASGGDGGTNGIAYYPGGRGGYSEGTISLSFGQTLYVYVGGAGADRLLAATLTNGPGGWNGGGTGGIGAAAHGGPGGGGSSDIRFTTSTAFTGIAATDPRIIVAGGGGGAWGENLSNTTTSYMTPGTGGYGGGLSGGYAYIMSNEAPINPGTQSGGNIPWSGQSAGSILYHSGNGGGGGGFWGGRTYRAISALKAQGGGAGGSGFVGSPSLISGSSTAGNLEIPDPFDGITIGRTGNGFARISYLG